MSRNIIFFTTRAIDIPGEPGSNDKEENLFKNPDSNNEDFVNESIRSYFIHSSEKQYCDLKARLSPKDDENGEDDIEQVRESLSAIIGRRLSDTAFIATVNALYQDNQEAILLAERLSQMGNKQNGSSRFSLGDFDDETIRKESAINLDGLSSKLMIKHRLMLYKMNEEKDNTDIYNAYAIWPLSEPATGEYEEKWKKALTDEIESRFSEELAFHLILGFHDGDFESTKEVPFKCLSYKEPIKANDNNKVRSIFVFQHPSPEMSKLKVKQGDNFPTAKEVFRYFDGILSSDCYRVFSKVDEENLLASKYKELQNVQ